MFFFSGCHLHASDSTTACAHSSTACLHLQPPAWYGRMDRHTMHRPIWSMWVMHCHIEFAMGARHSWVLCAGRLCEPVVSCVASCCTWARHDHSTNLTKLIACILMKNKKLIVSYRYSSGMCLLQLSIQLAKGAKKHVNCQTKWRWTMACLPKKAPMKKIDHIRNQYVTSALCLCTGRISQRCIFSNIYFKDLKFELLPEVGVNWKRSTHPHAYKHERALAHAPAQAHTHAHMHTHTLVCKACY